MGNNVEVRWSDATVYTWPFVPKSLPDKVTIGQLYKETDEYVIIRHPKTFEIFNDETQEEEISSKGATFYYLPRGMIKKITYFQ